MASSVVIKHVDDLREMLRAHVESGNPVGHIDFANESIQALSAADMTVKVSSGISLNNLQRELVKVGQWLPIDPWNGNISIKHLLDENLYGPRRYGFGTIREHLIGMEMILPDGRLAQSGGNVVKNVAGYDLQKVFIGARQSLGIVVSATFKLLPKPELESFSESAPLTVTEAGQLTQRILDSPVIPSVLDWRNNSNTNRVIVVVGFSGSRPEVEWQLEHLDSTDWKATKPSNYDAAFFGKHGNWQARTSILPSRLEEIVEEIEGRPFLARAGNGVVWSSGLDSAVGTERNIQLESRLKETFDPAGIMPNIND